jgi:hypothetical protein
LQEVTQEDGSGMVNGDFRVIGTCGGCRSWGNGQGTGRVNTGKMLTNTTTQPFILAWGSPAKTLASDDPTVRLTRHNGYGTFLLACTRTVCKKDLADSLLPTAHFTMNTIQATGPRGVDLLAALPATNSSNGATLVGSLQEDDDRQGLAHGIVMALATLIAAPVDIITAGALRRWPALHIITSTGLMAFVLAGMGVGIYLSRLYLVVS